ncbi:MAG: TrmB family transcriptional regulator [Firmicutes bacterium]|nr:TrmB family transcriptional regulator [Bacillota bacterium]MDH7494573.1 helix-turn-helix domain-containing protein [Bacillota bacterium]
MDALAALASLGFTEYEAKTYVALLRASPATGYQISKEAGIPRSMVYEALGRLVNKGAVLTLQHGDVTRYAPIPVNALLDNMRHRYEEAIDAAHESLARYETLIPLDQAWNIEGRDAILGKARDMIGGAKGELLLAVGDRNLVDLMPSLREAHERGVRVRVLLSGDAECDFGTIVHHPQAESAFQQLGKSIVVVADGSQALVGGTDADDTAVWTGNPHLVFIARQYIWQEMFTQRASERLGKDFWAALSPEEREAIFGE